MSRVSPFVIEIQRGDITQPDNCPLPPENNNVTLSAVCGMQLVSDAGNTCGLTGGPDNTIYTGTTVILERTTRIS